MRLGLIAVVAICASTVSPLALACERPAAVCSSSTHGSFPLIRSGQPASLFVDSTADSAVKLVADSFAADLERVCGGAARACHRPGNASGDLVIIGCSGQSAVIDENLVRARLNAGPISSRGQWRRSARVVVDRPFPKVAQAL
jgi:hypothetical protein